MRVPTQIGVAAAALAVAFASGCGEPLEVQSQLAPMMAPDPDWPVGRTWTVEVHRFGSRTTYEHTLPLFGVTHFWVAKNDGRRVVLRSRHYPIDVGFRTENLGYRCEIELGLRPLSLERVELGSFFPEVADAEEVPLGRLSHDKDAWPCFLPLPHHPAVRTHHSAEHRGTEVRFREGNHTMFLLSGEPLGFDRPRPRLLIAWRGSDPWWSRMETIDGDDLSVFGRLHGERCKYCDGLAIERARLIAVDGVPVQPMPWGTPAEGSQDWARLFWPDGEMLPRAEDAP